VECRQRKGRTWLACAEAVEEWGKLWEAGREEIGWAWEERSFAGRPRAAIPT